MKIALIFARLKPRRQPLPRAQETSGVWTPREWADLPVHHPRNG